MAAVLADLVVAIHVAYVAFVVVGQLLILAGAACHWSWVGNFWFRAVHLLAIGLVALEAVIGMACPLTVWEDELRQRAGQDVTEGSFVGRWLHALIFYHFDSWVLTAIHVGFALLVLATMILAPPRRPSLCRKIRDPEPEIRNQASR